MEIFAYTLIDLQWKYVKSKWGNPLCFDSIRVALNYTRLYRKPNETRVVALHACDRDLHTQVVWPYTGACEKHCKRVAK